jgi:hypothetical protein
MKKTTKKQIKICVCVLLDMNEDCDSNCLDYNQNLAMSPKRARRQDRRTGWLADRPTVKQLSL